MKILIVTALLATAFSLNAQTTTNIDWRVRVETVTAGVTNTVTTNFRWDAPVKKDGLRIDGLALAFANARAGGYTNDFGAWIKQDVVDRAKQYQDAKQAADNSALLTKIQSLLLSNPDLLSASDLANLQTIAAKAP